MGIHFRKKEEWFHFFDASGNEIRRKTEIRFDPLTQETSRLVFDPGMKVTPPDYFEEAEKTGGANCPFCADNVLKLTPVFPNRISEQGRIAVGDALLFPNLFPYSKHNGVVIFSKKHYVQLEEFTETMIRDAFMAAKQYIERVMANDEDARYASINWNYLPLAGGSILHPHLHIIVSETPMNYQDKMNKYTSSYEKEHGEDFLEKLYVTEKALGERWIGEKGNVAWMHAFAPKSHNDFIAIFPRVSTVSELSEQDIFDFASSLKGIFATLASQGFASFNMALTFTEHSQIHARLIPRLTVGALSTSDMSFFQALQQEPLSYKVPEEVAKIARESFKNI
ncbi:hypothetical protein H1D32_11020 [Anaerobacillus sp. CMMVII]|uniref:hypothetical protein n=1 Tax=Anaerobacillus sp. CMMVII TaxID=2755588 RepID=UPI0021B80875|nr:hypothetical protein [Anaerobacillus sp. CMMVII]MCT8138236.1 hypothetical protein [Anaerobacillus sp. CMMVII]